MATGKISKWVADRGFGFITPQGGGGDVFCHIRSVMRGDPSITPRIGEPVRYEQEQRADGRMMAVNVVLVDDVD